MSVENLKLCPHCGGAAYFQKTYSEKKRRFFVCIRCAKCKSQSRYHSFSETPTEAQEETDACNAVLEAWNRRTAEGE